MLLHTVCTNQKTNNIHFCLQYYNSSCYLIITLECMKNYYIHINAVLLYNIATYSYIGVVCCSYGYITDVACNNNHNYSILTPCVDSIKYQLVNLLFMP